MELGFQSQTYHFLRNVVRDTRFQEETAEIIVPDSYPDIAAIADSCADAVLRGKDCRDGSMTVAGGVKGVILYIPEDQTYPRKLEVYIPFTVKFDHPALTASAQVICSVRIRSVDARMINSRKAMLRVNLGCEIHAYEDASDDQYELKEVIPGLEIKEAAYSTILPRETGEKSFALNDTLEIPTGRPPVFQIYWFHCVPELSDEKLIGNKAVFKGTLRCKLLYLSDNHTLYLHEQNFPFSQYCELRGDYDQETAAVQIAATGYDVDSSVIAEGMQIPISINLLAQCTVYGQQTVTVIEDAYYTKGELHPQWKEMSFDGCLDRQNYMQTVRQRISGNLREVLDTNVYWDFPEIVRNGEQADVKLPAVIRVLGYDDSGMLCALSGRAEARQPLDLSGQASCHASGIPTGEVFSTADAGGVEARCSAQITIGCYSKEKPKTLFGGTIDAEAEDNSNRPALIVRNADSGTALWDLAKQYRTTVSDIQSANQLNEAVLDEDMTCS